MTPDAPAEPPSAQGPPVADGETLLRAVTPGAAKTWIVDGRPTSAAFSHPKFSSDVFSLTNLAEFLARWPAGSQAVAYPAGAARRLGFDARHEPEHGNAAHANVYCDRPPSQRKKHARRLAEDHARLLDPPA